MKYWILLILLFSSVFAFAQLHRENLRINPTLAGEPLELGKKYYVSEIEDSVQIESLKFYISKLEFFQDENWLASLDPEHLLVDAERPETFLIPLLDHKDKKFNKIKFKLGVDSLTSVSGVFGGDLDPTNGMYWTWQSGYIHIKLEGKADKCPGRNHVFQFHLGGYQAPFSTLQKIELFIPDANDLTLNFSLDKFFSQVNLEENYQIMSPSYEAVMLAQKISHIFSLSE